MDRALLEGKPGSWPGLQLNKIYYFGIADQSHIEPFISYFSLHIIFLNLSWGGEGGDVYGPSLRPSVDRLVNGSELQPFYSQLTCGEEMEPSTSYSKSPSLIHFSFSPPLSLVSLFPFRKSALKGQSTKNHERSCDLLHTHKEGK